MGNLTSTLTMRLIDGVSNVAPKIQNALQRIHGSAQRATGRTLVGAAAGGSGVGLAGLSRSLMGGVAAYVGGREAVDAYKGFAAFERRLSRVGITADATVEHSKRAGDVVKRIGKDLALPQEDVLQGLEGLVAAGRTLPDALNFLPAVAKTAQASGAAVADIASTADALGTSLKIPADQMERMFDYLVQQGKAGKFELKDMARYLPSIAPAAAAVGMSGVEGANKIAALLQVVRQGTGTAEEAAASVQNIFAKMESEETAKRFKKMGIDLRKEMKAARAQGKDLLDVFTELAFKATKGDLSKIPQLFSDQEFARGMRALLSRRGELQRLIAEGLKQGLGAVNRDVSRVTGDAEASIQRLANAWENTKQEFGKTLDAGGVTTFLESVADGLKDTQAELKNFAEILAALQAGDYAKAASLAAAAAKRGAGLLVPPVEPPPKVAELDDIGRREAIGKLPGQFEELAKAQEALQTLQGSDRAGTDEFKHWISVLQKEINLRMQETNALVSALLPRLPEGPSGLPPELASKGFRTGGGFGSEGVSGATRARPRSNLGPVAPPAAPSPVVGLDLPDANLGVKADEAAAAAAGQAAHAAAQRAADAMGPIRFKSVVDAPSVSGAIGNRVSSGLDGSHSDNSGRR